jgi:DtxR family Mn-dependent transcriptional regulator
VRATRDLSESLEDYLEAVLVLERERRVARVRDIAARLGVRMPSVHTALHRLEDQGLVRHARYEYVELTAKGRRAAERVHGRHAALEHFLVDVLHVPPAIAKADACRMEHGLHRQTVRNLERFLASLAAEDGSSVGAHKSPTGATLKSQPKRRTRAHVRSEG